MTSDVMDIERFSQYKFEFRSLCKQLFHVHAHAKKCYKLLRQMKTKLTRIAEYFF